MMGKNSGRSICVIFSKDLELKVEFQGDHATFLNMDITIKEGTFTYKSLDKKSFLLLLNCDDASYTKQYPSKSFLFRN